MGAPQHSTHQGVSTGAHGTRAKQSLDVSQPEPHTHIPRSCGSRPARSGADTASASAWSPGVPPTSVPPRPRHCYPRCGRSPLALSMHPNGRRLPSPVQPPAAAPPVRWLPDASLSVPQPLPQPAPRIKLPWPHRPPNANARKKAQKTVSGASHQQPDSPFR